MDIGVEINFHAHYE